MKINGWKSLMSWRRRVNASATYVLDMPQWKDVEEEIRKDITRLYKSLLKATPDDVVRIQMQITLRTEFFSQLYESAGKLWQWTGYLTLDDAATIDHEDDIELEYEQLVEAGAIKAGQE